MFASFRLSMTWVHTWLGLVLGYLLMAAFFFGALAVFASEIDRWALPNTRFAPVPMPSFDRVLLPALQKLQPEDVENPEKLPATRYYAYASARDPVMSIGAGFATSPTELDGAYGYANLDPRNGAIMPDDQLQIGGSWFYPLHFSLNLGEVGTYLVGLASLVLMVALVSGVVIHRKIFREFFTFRPKKHVQRSTLDLHNMTGVLALPFHFFFAFTGLLVFASYYYFPVSAYPLKALSERHEATQAAATGLPNKPAGVAAPLASVDAMVAEAQRRWAARGISGEVGFLEVAHVGDSNSYVSISRRSNDSVISNGAGVYFKASTGEVLREEPPPSVVSKISSYLIGLHLMPFRHVLLSWLYVLGGLLGCVCIATGFIFFVEKRKHKHAKASSHASRVVDGLAVAAVTGMVMATVGLCCTNRIADGMTPAPDGPMPRQPPVRFEDGRSG